MSTDVVLDRLGETVAGFAIAYLLTLGDRPRPHVGAVDATVADGVVRIGGVGPTSLRNMAGHDAVTLLWPPLEPDGYALIVDGTATAAGDHVDVVPHRAVLHRRPPTPRPSDGTDGSCAADCMELPV